MIKDKSLLKDMNPFGGFIVGISKSCTESFFTNLIGRIVPS
jgi:hypothetical protein